MGTHPIFESDFDCLTDFVKMVKIVESQADFDAVINGNTLVCVDFWATWCGPCKMIAPKLEAMSEKYTEVVFAKCDVDDNSETAEEVGISAMPTFKFYKDGKQIAE